MALRNVFWGLHSYCVAIRPLSSGLMYFGRSCWIGGVGLHHFLMFRRRLRLFFPEQRDICGFLRRRGRDCRWWCEVLYLHRLRLLPTACFQVGAAILCWLRCSACVLMAIPQSKMRANLLSLVLNAMVCGTHIRMLCSILQIFDPERFAIAG